MFSNSIKVAVKQILNDLLTRNTAEVEQIGKELAWGEGVVDRPALSRYQIATYSIGSIQLTGTENSFAYVMAPTETGRFSLEELRDGVELHRDLARVTTPGVYFCVRWNQPNHWALDINQENGPSYWGERNSSLATIVRSGDRYFTGPGFTPFLVTYVGRIKD